MKATKTMLDQMHQWIDAHQSEIIEELRTFVRIKSVSRADQAVSRAPYGPQMREMLDYALMRGASYGFTVVDHEGHCGSIIAGNPNHAIGIFGHLDVVPEGHDWQWPPYEATRVGDFVIGRGVSDNKSACVMGLMLMRMVKELGIKLNHGLRLVCGCSEETGMADMAYFSKTQIMPEISFVPDMRFPVCYAQKGMMKAHMSMPIGDFELISFDGGEAENMVPPKAQASLKLPLDQVKSALSGIEGIAVEGNDQTSIVSAQGLSAHAAYPYTGRSAINMLAKALSESGLLSDMPKAAMAAIQDLSGNVDGDQAGIAGEDPETGKTTMVLATIKTNGKKLQLTVDGRLSIAADLDQIDHNFSQYALDKGFMLDNFKIDKPFYMPKDDPRIVALMDLYKEMTGDDAPAYTSGGGTYSRALTNAITFGPGFDGGVPVPEGLIEGHGGAHAPDEYLHIPSYIRAMKIYAAAIVEVDQL